MEASLSSSSPPPPPPATPLWRNGPEGKPVLCSVCRAYMPKHFHEGLRKNLENLKDNDNINVAKDKPSTDIPTSGRTILSFWDVKIPTRKRSRVVYERITPMEKFHNQLYNLWRFYGNPDEPEEVLLEQNTTNNFIPSDEIGLGAILLKQDDDVAPSPTKKASN